MQNGEPQQTPNAPWNSISNMRATSTDYSTLQNLIASQAGYNPYGYMESYDKTMSYGNDVAMCDYLMGGGLRDSYPMD